MRNAKKLIGKILLIVLLLCVILFLFTTNLVVTPVSQLAEKNARQQRISQLNIAAENGNVDAQVMLGILYTGQLGVKPDYKKSLFWTSKAAKQNNAVAQNAMGVIYMKGLGVTQDYKKAMSWFRLAAKQGNSEAQNSIGFMYAHSLGVLMNLTKAIHWFTLSAKQGNPSAQNNLGILYLEGSMGLPPNIAKGQYWLLKSANQGYKPAISNLKKLEYRQKHHLSQKKFFEESVNKKLRSLEKRAKDGDAHSQFLLGIIYKIGIKDPQLRDVILPNEKLAKFWLKKAEKNGDLDAKKLLATDNIRTVLPSLYKKECSEKSCNGKIESFNFFSVEAH